jgi:hypothetical protein
MWRMKLARVLRIVAVSVLLGAASVEVYFAVL